MTNKLTEDLLTVFKQNSSAESDENSKFIYDLESVHF